jgi:hypothetical protein
VLFHSNSSLSLFLSVTTQNFTRDHMKICDSEQYYHLQKHWPFSWITLYSVSRFVCSCSFDEQVTTMTCPLKAAWCRATCHVILCGTFQHDIWHFFLFQLCRFATREVKIMNISLTRHCITCFVCILTHRKNIFLDIATYVRSIRYCTNKKFIARNLEPYRKPFNGYYLNICRYITGELCNLVGNICHFPSFL